MPASDKTFDFFPLWEEVPKSVLVPCAFQIFFESSPALRAARALISRQRSSASALRAIRAASWRSSALAKNIIRLLLQSIGWLNPSKGPHLYLRRRAGREPCWTIRNGNHELGTGSTRGERSRAEKRLQETKMRKTLLAIVVAAVRPDD